MIKRTSSIAKLMSQLDGIKVTLEDLQQQRENTFEGKSEKWQESDKGDEYGSDTTSLEDIVQKLDEAYSDMENLFEEE